MELGSLLKKAREKKGLSIEDIQEETKIRKKYIEAIEENNFEILPGTVYLKVFVKGYAREVGLDYQELLSNYEALNIEEKRESKLNKDYLDGAKISHAGKNNKSKNKPLKIIFIILLTLFLAAVAVYTYQYFSDADIRLLSQQNQKKESTKIIEEKEGLKSENKAVDKTETVEADQNLKQEKEPVIDLRKDGNDQTEPAKTENDLQSFVGLSDEQVNLEEKSEIIIPENKTAEANLKLNDGGSEAGAELEDFKSEEFSSETTDLESNLNSADSSAAEKSSDLKQQDEAGEESSDLNTAADKIKEQDKTQTEIETDKSAAEKIIISSADTAWITVDLDSKNVFSGILEAGDQRDFNFEDSLYLKIGNGSAITARIGEEKYGPWAENGQIAEVEITKEEGQIKINNLRN